MVIWDSRAVTSHTQVSHRERIELPFSAHRPSGQGERISVTWETMGQGLGYSQITQGALFRGVGGAYKSLSLHSSNSAIAVCRAGSTKPT